MHDGREFTLPRRAQRYGLGLVLAVAQAGEVLGTREHQLHRALHGLGRQRGQHRVGPHVVLAAKAPANELAHDPHLLLPQAQQRSQRLLDQGYRLGRVVDRQPVGRLPVGRRRTRFHGIVVVNAVRVGGRDFHRRGRQCGLGVAPRLAAQVAAIARVLRVE